VIGTGLVDERDVVQTELIPLDIIARFKLSQIAIHVLSLNYYSIGLILNVPQLSRSSQVKEKKADQTLAYIVPK
jgi:hypothetical protein